MKPLVAALLTVMPATAREANRAITKIAGEVYRFQNSFHYPVFAVTPDGIIATDPIDAETGDRRVCFADTLIAVIDRHANKLSPTAAARPGRRSRNRKQNRKTVSDVSGQ